MLLIGIGVFNYLTGRKNAAIILVSIGAFFLIQDYGPYDLRDFWPLILIIVGVVFILRRKSEIAHGENRENFFDDINIFSGGEKKFASHPLEGGRVTNIFGGSTIDLRDSAPIHDATIEIFTMFGGCEIIVPEDWKVKIEAVSLFGAFTDERRNTSYDPDSPQIIIKGFTIFGGGELKNR